MCYSSKHGSYQSSSLSLPVGLPPSKQDISPEEEPSPDEIYDTLVNILNELDATALDQLDRTPAGSLDVGTERPPEESMGLNLGEASISELQLSGCSLEELVLSRQLSRLSALSIDESEIEHVSPEAFAHTSMTLFEELDRGAQQVTDAASQQRTEPTVATAKLHAAPITVGSCELTTVNLTHELQAQVHDARDDAHTRLAMAQDQRALMQAGPSRPCTASTGAGSHWPCAMEPVNNGPHWPCATTPLQLRVQTNFCTAASRCNLSPVQQEKFRRARSFKDTYAEDDEEWIGKRVRMKKGKYAGRGAFVKSRANKKYRVQVDGVPDQVEFYPTSFEHV